jgi:regulator of protease activity HflC (stomatin/prohibitin superfamily)
MMRREKSNEAKPLRRFGAAAPILERQVRIDLRTVTLEIPPQDVITRDNVTVKVSAVLYFRVIDPSRAVTEVRDYLFATFHADSRRHKTLPPIFAQLGSRITVPQVAQQTKTVLAVADQVAVRLVRLDFPMQGLGDPSRACAFR